MQSDIPAQDEPLQWRKVLLYCLPALIVALVLRVILMAHMPYAFVISDTREFAGTSLSLASHGLNPFGATSRTFLAKVLYAFPVFVNQPILPWAAFIQHVFGLGAVIAAGFLCRLWLTQWRWWIVPLTMIVAVHPTLLWYEHMALPDSTFVAAVLMSAVFAGLYYRRPTPRLLGWFAVALILATSSRQEGFLFLPLGVLLTLSRHRWELKKMWRRVAVMAGILLLGILTSRTTQGGQMLLTSTIHMAPDHLWLTKGFSEEAVELRDYFKPRWPAYPADHNKARKIITHRVSDYVASLEGDPDNSSKVGDKLNNKTCKRIGVEIALRNWWRLPKMAFNKFRATHLEPPSPDFGVDWAHKKHVSIFFGKPGEKLPKDNRYLKAYFGQEFQDREEAAAAFDKMYRVMDPDWLTKFQHGFVQAAIGWRFPRASVPYGEVAKTVPATFKGKPLSELKTAGQPLPGLPGLYVVGFVGLLIAALRCRTWLSYRQLWILILLFEAFAIFTTGSLRSRYRLIYEPWWFLGFFCILDSIVVFFRGGWRVLRDGDTLEPVPADKEAAAEPVVP